MKWLVLFLTVPQILWAQLSDQSYLNKLSHSLRGIPPSVREYAELKEAIKKNETDKFFAAKRYQYLSSVMHAEKMRWRISELFKLAPSNNALITNSQAPDFEYKEKDRYNATDAFLLKLVLENRSWDYLITGSDYRIHTHEEGVFTFDTTDKPFFHSVLPQEIKEKMNSLPAHSSLDVSFPEEDGRFAGILTSPKFFNRYGTTAVNKNRRRAAIIFKNFLCDPMVAAVPDPGANKDAITNLQFPAGLESSKTQFTEQEILAARQMQDDKHGSQADCKSCHYKLDPMGRVFIGSTASLSSRPWPGALVFKNSKNQIVNEPVRNIRELGTAITQQPEYVSCQIGHFWSWFIGNDIPLIPAVRAELESEFEKRERKVNSFVDYLVQRPEFKRRVTETPKQKITRYTKQIFNKCQSCHNGKIDDTTGEPLINLTQWPLGSNNSIQDPAYWIKRISTKLDLKGGGRNRSMPPPSINWSLTREELLLIQSWMDLGAPDENGQKQVNP